MDIIDGMSMDIEAAERDKLRAVFPQCFVEDKLDIDKLLSLCGEYITDDFEKYEFKWKGKSECLQLAQKRSTGTLRPCREESVNFDTTKNLYIEGDNLEVLKLLQTSYYRKVKMIYIDPPYNTGHDFVYADDFADPMARYKEVTSQTTKSNPETMGRYHTNWLNMMYPRLRLAANLLRDDGVIFISIDDGEQSNLRKICDEVFGEENFVANIMWQKRYSPANDHKTICPIHDFIMVYQKSGEWQRNLLPRSEQNDSQYRYEDEKGIFRPDNYKCNKTADERPNLYYPIINPNTGEEIWPSRDAVWRYSKERHQENVVNDMVFWGKDGTSKTPAFKRYRHMLRNGGGVVPGTWWTYEFAGHNDEAAKELSEYIGNRVFSTPKPTKLITKLLQLSTNPTNEDIVLDFFSGSGATAHAVMQLNAEDGGNRRFIMVQLPEVCDEKSEAYKAGYKNICEIGKERIRRAGVKIQAENDKSKDVPLLETEEEMNLLVAAAHAKGPEGVAQVKPLFKRVDMSHDIDTGFRVFKLDTSNLKLWDNTPIPGGDITELERRLRGMLEIVKDDRDNLDVVYEVMLKLGQDLCEDILTLDINGKTVYGVGAECDFIVCLASSITAEDAEEMAEYAPGRIIFTDQCFDTSSDKRNVQLTLKDRGINMKML